MILREYQATLIQTVWDWFRSNPTGHPIVSACVGSGKSVMIAHLCQQAITQWAGTRIVMVVASKELAEQNLAKLLAVWPDAPVSVHSAAMRRKEIGKDILYCTIGSIHKKAHLLGRVDLLLIDECHAVPHKEEGMYRTFISNLERYNPALRVIGWTGTPFRGNGVWLHAGENALFTGIAATAGMAQLLDMGFLSPLKSAATLTKLDASGVKLSGGDYVVSQLAAKIDIPALVERACDEIVSLGADRKRWLVFGVTVEHAGHIAAALQLRGINCAVVSANTPLGEREQIIKLFRSGHFRALVNVAVLTTGFDVPEIDLIALLRNTKSPVLYNQIAGRGMRIAEGKENCLWLDFTDTTAELGAVDTLKGHAPKLPGDAPIKFCPDCGNTCPAGALHCPSCNHEFPQPDRDTDRHRARVSDAAIMSGEIVQKINRYEVTRVSYGLHQKEGRPDSLKVEYWNHWTRIASEWVCLDHGGYAKARADHWWQQRAPREHRPGGVAQAIEWLNDGYLLKVPTAITVNETGKFPEIVSFEWSTEDEQKRAA